MHALIFQGFKALVCRSYESTPTGQYYDTIVVTNDYSFTVIAHHLPEYEGEEEKYPYYAVGHGPLYEPYPWLDLFGF